MRRDILNKLFFCSLLAMLFACGTKKEIVLTPSKTAVKDTVAVIPIDTVDEVALVKAGNFQFNTLSLKGKAKLDIDGNENNVSINIRIKKDEIIWVSVSAVIGEVARVAITPDSIRIINRLETTYTKKAFNFIHQFTSNKIDFSVLQAVLVGNTVDKLLNKQTEAKQINSVWELTGNEGSLAYRFLFNTLTRLDETNLNDAAAAQALKVVYASYKPLNNSHFPEILKLNSMAGANKINIQIEYSAVEGNVELDFPFSVRSRFKVIN